MAISNSCVELPEGMSKVALAHLFWDDAEFKYPWSDDKGVFVGFIVDHVLATYIIYPTWGISYIL